MVIYFIIEKTPILYCFYYNPKGTKDFKYYIKLSKYKNFQYYLSLLLL